MLGPWPIQPLTIADYTSGFSGVHHLPRAELGPQRGDGTCMHQELDEAFSNLHDS